MGDFFCGGFSDWFDWLVGSRKLRKVKREGKEEIREAEVEGGGCRRGGHL